MPQIACASASFALRTLVATLMPFSLVFHEREHALQRMLHRLPAHCLAITGEMQGFRPRGGARCGPRHAHRADRLRRRAAARPGDAAYRDRDLCVTVEESTSHH